MEELNILALGFSDKEITAIENNFLCRLTLEDWESMHLLVNKEELFKYLYTDNVDKETAVRYILEEIISVTADSLSENETVLDLLTDQDDNLVLPSGRCVVFPEELLKKEQLFQID